MLQIDVMGKWLTRIKGTKEHKIRLPAVAISEREDKTCCLLETKAPCLNLRRLLAQIVSIVRGENCGSAMTTFSRRC